VKELFVSISPLDLLGDFSGFGHVVVKQSSPISALNSLELQPMKLNDNVKLYPKPFVVYLTVWSSTMLALCLY
jgi:hypothetical protein